MSFAAPLFLAATLAVILPLLLHLIHRQKAREVPFPTLRFLELSVQKTRKRKYLDDLVLLLLRMALLFFLALGLAKPALSSLAHLIGQGSDTAAVIVLDNSGSMSTVDADGPRFEVARQRVGLILDSLSETDSVLLLPTNGPAETPPGLLHSLAPVRQQLAAISTYPQRADLAAAITRAQARLDEAPAQRRELYVVTDNQAINYDDLSPPATRATARAASTPLIIVDVGQSDPQLDVALTGLALASPAPLAGVPVTARATLANPSGVAQTRTVELRLNDQPLALSPAITIPPGGAAAHEFRFTADSPGVHQGEVRLVEDDAAAFNNALAFALVADPPIPIAILKPRRHEIPQSDVAFYLERALSPALSTAAAAPADGFAAAGPRLTTLLPDELTRTPLTGQSVVFCVDLPALDPEQAQVLASYVRGGGHLVWIAGPNVNAAAYNTMNDQAGGLLLPGPVSDLRTPPAHLEAGGWSVARIDHSHPALAGLQEPPSLYRSVLVTRHWPIAANPAAPAGAAIDASQAAGAHVLAALDDGQPLLVERNLGPAGGSSLWLGTSLRPDATNLPLKAIFLPLFSRLTFHLAGAGTGQSAALVGTPLTIPLPAAPGPVEIQRPSGEILRRTPEPVNAPSFTYTDTYQPGVYQMQSTTSRPPRPFAFALNPEPIESQKIARIDPDALRAQLSPQRRAVEIVSTPADLSRSIRLLREGTPLRDAFLALVLLGLVSETFIANRKRSLPATAVAATSPTQADDDDQPRSAPPPPPPGRPRATADTTPSDAPAVVLADGQVLRFD